jgi:hypothetical protein
VNEKVVHTELLGRLQAAKVLQTDVVQNLTSSKFHSTFGVTYNEYKIRPKAGGPLQE